MLSWPGAVITVPRQRQTTALALEDGDSCVMTKTLITIMKTVRRLKTVGQTCKSTAKSWWVSVMFVSTDGQCWPVCRGSFVQLLDQADQ